MNTSIKSILFLAGILFAAGLGVSLFALISYPEYQRLLDRKESELSRAADIARQYAELNTVVSNNMAVYARALRQPLPILDKTSKSTPVEKSAALDNGWMLRTADLSADSLPPEQLIAFSEILAGSVPPWKVSRLVLRALPDRKINVSMTITSVAR